MSGWHSGFVVCRGNLEMLKASNYSLKVFDFIFEKRFTCRVSGLDVVHGSLCFECSFRISKLTFRALPKELLPSVKLVSLFDPEILMDMLKSLPYFRWVQAYLASKLYCI